MNEAIQLSEGKPTDEKLAVQLLQVSGAANDIVLVRDGDDWAAEEDVTAFRECAARVAKQRLAEAGRLHAEDALRESEERLRQAQMMEAVGRQSRVDHDPAAAGRHRRRAGGSRKLPRLDQIKGAAEEWATDVARLSRDTGRADRSSGICSGTLDFHGDLVLS